MSQLRTIVWGAAALLTGLGLAAPAGAQIATTHGVGVNGAVRVQGEKRNGDERVETVRFNDRRTFEGVEGEAPERGEGLFAVCSCGTDYACTLVTARTDPASILSEFGAYAVNPPVLQEGGRDSLVQRSVGFAAVFLEGSVFAAGLFCSVDTRYSPLGEAEACIRRASLRCTGELEFDSSESPEGVTDSFRITIRNRSTSVDLTSLE